MHAIYVSGPCTHASLAICQKLWLHAQDSLCEEHVWSFMFQHGCAAFAVHQQHGQGCTSDA